MKLEFGIPPDLVRQETSEYLPLAGEINWGIEKFDVARLRDKTLGTNIIAGICDTGVDHKHPLIKDNYKNARDFTGSRNGTYDGNGHGSHCTSTVCSTDPRIGMACQAKYVHAKVLSDGGSGGDDWISDGMQWCADQGAVVISMSLGSASQSPRIVAKMQELAESARKVWFVCAAGNSGPNTPDVDWPGRSPYCISVAALNLNLTPASFSSAGAKIDTSFAGVDIWGAKPGGGYAKMSGTSMATPGVAGCLVLYRSLLEMYQLDIPSVFELRELLKNDSTDTHTPGVDRRTGPGWLNPLFLAMNTIPNPKPLA